MVKKEKVNKSQAVRDYLRAHPGAKSSPEIAAALTKRGITITPAHVANIKSKAQAKRSARKASQRPLPVASRQFRTVRRGGVPPNIALTLQHVKAVAQTVKTIGGFDRLNELLRSHQGSWRLEEVQGLVGGDGGN